MSQVCIGFAHTLVPKHQKLDISRPQRYYFGVKYQQNLPLNEIFKLSYIISKLECKYILHFSGLTMKFHKCHHTNLWHSSLFSMQFQGAADQTELMRNGD